jgi:hypothetical protein
MEKEMKAMADRKVLKLVPLSDMPKGRKIIGCHPVRHIKRDSEGKVVDHKVRLVAQGFTQVAGVDYTDTFAPSYTLARSATGSYDNLMSKQLSCTEISKRRYTCVSQKGMKNQGKRNI